MARKINIGIVGFGDGGKSNFKSLSLIASVEVTAICDINEEAFEGNEDCAVFTDYESFLSWPDLDLVIVATPDHLHLEIAKKALEAGMHVFVEKPLATSMDDLLSFMALNDRFPGKLHFGEKYSYAYPIEFALEKNDELGEFLTGYTSYMMWRCGRIMKDWRVNTPYNPWAGGLSHNLMTLRLFIGSPILRVCATGQVRTYHNNLNLHGGFDTMQGIVEFANGKVITCAICLAIEGDGSAYGHRTVSHIFQFRNGALVYGANPDDDLLVVGKDRLTPSSTEPSEKGWGDYNINVLYGRMHADLLNAVRTGEKMRHSV